MRERAERGHRHSRLARFFFFLSIKKTPRDFSLFFCSLEPGIQRSFSKLDAMFIVTLVYLAIALGISAVVSGFFLERWIIPMRRSKTKASSFPLESNR